MDYDLQVALAYKANGQVIYADRYMVTDASLDTDESGNLWRLTWRLSPSEAEKRERENAKNQGESSESAA